MGCLVLESSCMWRSVGTGALYASGFFMWIVDMYARGCSVQWMQLDLRLVLSRKLQ